MQDPTKQKKGKKKEFDLNEIRNDITTRKQLQGFIEEIVLHEREISNRKEDIGDIFTEAEEALGIPKKVLGKLVREELKPGSLEAEVQVLEGVQEIVDVISPKAP